MTVSPSPLPKLQSSSTSGVDQDCRFTPRTPTECVAPELQSPSTSGVDQSGRLGLLDPVALEAR